MTGPCKARSKSGGGGERKRKRKDLGGKAREASAGAQKTVACSATKSEKMRTMGERSPSSATGSTG